MLITKNYLANLVINTLLLTISILFQAIIKYLLLKMLLDHFDIAILTELQADGRVSNRELTQI